MLTWKINTYIWRVSHQKKTWIYVIHRGPTDAYMCQEINMPMVQITVCRMAIIWMLTYVQEDLGIKMQGNFTRSWNIYIQENASDIVSC